MSTHENALRVENRESQASVATLRRLVVIVPAYNEGESIGRTVSGLRSVEGRLRARGISLSVYVIDDGSTDQTHQRAIDAGADRVLRHRVNQGVGAAVRTGIRAARIEGFDLLVKFDADLQHDPDDVLRIIEPVIYDEADVVYGNRFDKIEYKMPFVRRMGNIAFSNLMKFLTGWPLKDSAPGILCLGKEYIAVAFIPGDYNYPQQVLLDAYHKHMRFAHVAVAFRSRTTGKSFISLKYPFKVIPQILLVLASVKPLRIFVPIGLTFCLFGTTLFVIQLLNWAFGDGIKPVENANLVLGSVLFGLQTVFFGVLAQLIVQTRK